MTPSPDGEIVLIDFGSCGSYTEGQIRIVRHFHYCQANEDTSGMVQCVLALLEPLPPIDVDALAREGVVFSNCIAVASHTLPPIVSARRSAPIRDRRA